jgi:hypothetical protein
LAVIKKYRAAFAHVTNAPGNQEWEMQNHKWNDLTHEQILQLCNDWPEKPNVQHVRLT